MSDQHPKYDAFVERNLELAHQMLQRQFENPELLNEIPDGATIVFLPDDDPELAAFNLEVGLESLRRGRDVFFRHVHSPASTMASAGM